MSFVAASYRVSEEAERLDINIIRSGDTEILADVLVATESFQGTASG